MTKPKYKLLTYKDVESQDLRPTSKVQLSYSWYNINVYSEAKNEIRQSSFPKNIFQKKKENKEKHILKNVSGICRPGELLAILGASGAGKTTLLNVLNFRNNDRVRITGNLYINGHSVHPESLTSNSAYVQQDDLFIGTMTVREQLIFQAMLRMDRHFSYEQRMARVEEVIIDLGLTKCKDTKIGIPGILKGISGGETKRLAFACEVLTDPPILFCDEPTSGLDSFMAQTVVSVMKSMAERGKTIISTIHQPSSEVYQMFDRILLMAEGRAAFLGDVDNCYKFFQRIDQPCPENYNPADFFIQTLAIQPKNEEKCKANVHFICDKFATSEEGEAVIKAVKENQEASETISLLLGIIYYNQSNNQDGITNINGALFLILINMTFQNVFGVINIFCLQIPVFLREHFNGMYRTDTYFLSKTVAELPFQLIYPICFVALIYYMIGFTPGVVHFFICCGIAVLVGNTSTSFGYLISCLSKDLSIALVITTPFIVPLMLFGGFYLNKNSVPVFLSWFRYVSWFNYGNEALTINQWRNVTNIICDNDIGSCFRDGNSVLASLNYDKGSIGEDCLYLFLLMIVYRLFAYFGLLFKAIRRNQTKKE